MLLIVMHHYVVNSGLTDVMEQNPTSVGSIYLYLIGVWGKTCINCFVLITGYFMCQSRITLHKFLKLLLQIEFYSIVIGLTFMVSGYSQFSVRSLIDITNPIHAVGKNFTGCFLLFYLFIPFLNACINHLSQCQHLLLLILCVHLYDLGVPFQSSILSSTMLHGSVSYMLLPPTYGNGICRSIVVSGFGH